MINFNFDATLFSIGFLQIKWYGLIYALGVLLVYYVLYRNRSKLGLNEDEVTSYYFWVLVCMLIGARLGHLLSYPLEFFSNPLEFFMVWQGGMSFFGGLVGAVLVSYFYLKRKKVDWKTFADVGSVPTILALAFGRIGNFLNSELVGRASSLPFCVVFEKVDNICRHPYQLYASLSHFILFFVMLYVGKKKPKKGTVFLTFVVGYSLLRFITDFFRADPLYLWFTGWQWVSLVTLGVGLYFLYKTLKTK